MGGVRADLELVAVGTDGVVHVVHSAHVYHVLAVMAEREVRQQRHDDVALRRMHRQRHLHRAYGARRRAFVEEGGHDPVDACGDEARQGEGGESCGMGGGGNGLWKAGCVEGVLWKAGCVKGELCGRRAVEGGGCGRGAPLSRSSNPNTIESDRSLPQYCVSRPVKRVTTVGGTATHGPVRSGISPPEK